MPIITKSSILDVDKMLQIQPSIIDALIKAQVSMKVRLLPNF